MVYVLDGGGPKHSENTLNSFLTKCGENVFWQIGPDMAIVFASEILASLLLLDLDIVKFVPIS